MDPDVAGATLENAGELCTIAHFVSSEAMASDTEDLRHSKMLERTSRLEMYIWLRLCHDHKITLASIVVSTVPPVLR